MKNILLPAKGPEERDKLLAFLQKEFRAWPTLCQEHGQGSLVDPESDPTFPLEAKGRGLKIRFHSKDAFEYTYSLMRFAAIRVGQRRIPVGYPLTNPMPYYLCGPERGFPVLLVQKDSPLITQKETAPYAVNPLGIPWDLSWKPGLPINQPEATRKKKRKVIKAELMRLHKLWKQQD